MNKLLEKSKKLASHNKEVSFLFFYRSLIMNY